MPSKRFQLLGCDILTLIYIFYSHLPMQEVDEGYSITTVKHRLSNVIVTLMMLRQREPMSGLIQQTFDSYYQDVPQYVSFIPVL